ncbi:MAG: insulinase family protein [Endomicrobium sp.]|jgi:predicted Zn-dependent peptidase|nr:insulinase family protein [Endomicrobium sp.]
MKYNNGFTSILISNENSLTASVIVFVRVGSVDEKSSQAGLSHFIEHLMFKGSKNYPGCSFCKNVENFGGEINAATSKEFTMYYINMQKDFVEKSLKMLADTMQNPLFLKDEIDRERKVVIEEIQRYFDDPGFVLYEKFYKTIYKTSALKNSVIGTSDVISNISFEEIHEYYKMHYVPEKMLVVVSGGFDKEKIEKIIGNTFAKFEKKKAPNEPLLKGKSQSGKNITKYGKVEVGYMISGFLASDVDDEDLYVADLATDILGGGKSSRLYKSLYEKEHLVYAIDASFSVEKGGGNIYIASVFELKNIKEIKKEIEKQIEDIITNGIREDELNRSKLLLKTDWQFSSETPYDVAYKFGYWSLIGNAGFVYNYLEKLQDLASEDVVEFFKKYYSKNVISHTALLPNKSCR